MNYWTKRQKKLLNLTIEELEELLKDNYEYALNKTYQEMIDMYITILDEQGKPLISHLYAYNRYYNIIKKINNILTDLGSKEEKIFGEYLTRMYKDNETIINSEFSLTTHIDTDKVENIIREDWVGDGNNFSDRIWKDKTALANTLRRELVNAVETGKSADYMAKVLTEQFDVEFYKAKRLSRTELARVQLQSTLDKYREVGITKAKIIEAMDDRTCDKCRERHNSIIELKDIKDGGNILQHPMCRAILSPIVE